MFLNSWSLALSLCSIVVLFLVGMAGRTAVRVLRYWAPDSDSNRQIRLESEIWLSSTLVAYALGVQIITLVLFVLAADSFCEVIVGAMCATGALLANAYGMPALLVKITGVFLYGIWIVLHQLDIRSERYPLVRVKYFYLLALTPLLFADIALQTLYIAGLKPDIITSCCAVVFGENAGSGNVLFGGISQPMTLMLFYGGALALIADGFVLYRRWGRGAGYLFGVMWAAFFLLALYAIITVFSSYVYAMPYHNCPFCLLKPEYNYIGFPIYVPLFAAVFAGCSSALVEPVKRTGDLQSFTAAYQRKAIIISIVFLLLFLAVSSWHMLVYRIAGGEL
jgi:hypothetical protein